MQLIPVLLVDLVPRPQDIRGVAGSENAPGRDCQAERCDHGRSRSQSLETPHRHGQLLFTVPWTRIGGDLGTRGNDRPRTALQTRELRRRTARARSPGNTLEPVASSRKSHPDEPMGRFDAFGYRRRAALQWWSFPGGGTDNPAAARSGGFRPPGGTKADQRWGFARTFPPDGNKADSASTRTRLTAAAPAPKIHHPTLLAC
jgi:hypothetical protein